MSKKRTRWLIAVFVVLAMVVAACGDGDGADDGDTDTTTAGGDGGDGSVENAEFNLFGAPVGVEGDALEGFIDVYSEETGADISYRGSADFEQELRIAVDGGDPPSVAATPQPASICEFANDGHLVSLEDMGFDIAAMEENHSAYWMGLGQCDDGNHYGIPWFPNFKSVVFYHMPTFEENGYEIPETYEDMLALSQQMVDDGQTPWCIGFEDGGGTGWAATDWVEDIFVRLHGADVYADWYNHDIPFNDPAVVEAFDTFGDLVFAEGFVLGGASNMPGINVQDTPGPLFSDPAGCAMYKQGSFATNWFEQQPDYEEGEDAEIGVFAFPTIDGNTGAMGGGDTIIVFDDSPEVAQVVKDWVTPEWLCTLASATGGGVAEHGGHGVEGVERLPGHKDVNLDCYESESARTFAEAITSALEANTFVFDASDLMPPEVGQGAFWTGMIDWAQGTPTQEVVDSVEAAWPE